MEFENAGETSTGVIKPEVEETSTLWKKLENLPKSTYLIWILIYLLFYFNILLLLIYGLGHPDEDIANQIWNYFGSDPFTIISVSLILPILLIFLENHLDFMKNIRKRQELQMRDEKEELKERKEKLDREEKERKDKLEREEKERKEKREEKQKEAIDETAELLNQLFDLGSDIAYYKKDNPKGETIQDIRKKIHRWCDSSSQIANVWSHRFPKLPDEITSLFVYYFNIITSSYFHITRHILKDEGEVTDEIRELRKYIYQIDNGLYPLIVHFILHILKDYIAIENADEEGKVDLLKNRQNRIDFLKFYKKEIEDIRINNDKLFPSIDENDTDIKSFREGYKEFRKWGKDNKNVFHTRYSNFPAFKSKFYMIPPNKILDGLDFSYTDKYFIDLSKYLILNQISTKAMEF